MIRFALATAPASEPVTLAEAKAHARIEHDAEDALLTTYITAARTQIERDLGRALITQTWTATFDRWADATDEAEDDGWPFFATPTPRRVRLSPPPAAITSLVVDGVSIASTSYKLNGDELYVDGAVVDSTATLGAGIVITFTAGYGAGGANVPEPIKTALKMFVAHLYESARGATSPQGIYHQVTPYGFDAMLAHYRVFEV